MSIERLRRYAVRVLIVVLCLAAWWDLRPFAGAGERRPVAVLDVSRSVGGGTPALPEGIEARPHWVVVADGAQRVVGAAEPIRLGRGATRLGAGLRLAAEDWPGADVLLLTDGRETDGDALAGARRVAAAGGRVFVGPPTRPVADVGLLQARIRSAAPVVEIAVEVGASTSGGAELRLSREGRIVRREALTLEPDRIQEVILRDPEPPADGGTYRVVLVPGADTPNDDRGNDVLALGLRPRRRVVLTWGLGEEAYALRAPDLVVRRVEESGDDTDPGDLAAADCLVMANLPWQDVGTSAAQAVERFVASGGSLLLLGGPYAYAGGRWAGTRFERRLSPLRVPREDGTGLALLLAVDRSGSTAGATLAHLQEAVRRAVQGIVPGERMGVLPFDRVPASELLEPGFLGTDDADGLRTLLEQLDALEAGGETNLIAALDAAVDQVARVPAKERRVVLLTDGDPDRAPDRAALTEAARVARERGVEIGALVIDDPAAVRVLRETVATRPDDVQPLDDPQDLPLHLLHWLGNLHGRKAELPRPTRLEVLEPSLTLGELRPRHLERLEVASDVGARALAVAQYDDLPVGEVPFAAERQVGSGRVIAMAWGPAAEKLRVRSASVASIASWVRRLASASDRGLSGEVEGDVLRVRFPEAQGAGAVCVRSGTSERWLTEVRPGLFEGRLPTGGDTGLWVCPRGSEPPDRAVPERPLRLPALPPAESRRPGVDAARMAAIAEAGGGWRLERGVQPPPPPRGKGMLLAPWLLLAACFLLVLDRLWSKPLGSPTDS